MGAIVVPDMREFLQVRTGTESRLKISAGALLGESPLGPGERQDPVHAQLCLCT